MKNEKPELQAKFKNRIISFQPETLTLLDDTVIITYEDNPFEELRAAYKFHKDIQEYLHKKVMFDFNDIYLEIDEKTTINDIIDFYDYQAEVLSKIMINERIEELVSKFKDTHFQIENDAMNEILLTLKLFNSFITITNKRKIQEVMAFLVTEENKYLPLTSNIEIQKVKIKR